MSVVRLTKKFYEYKVVSSQGTSLYFNPSWDKCKAFVDKQKSPCQIVPYEVVDLG